jgi:hypothetical protein
LPKLKRKAKIVGAHKRKLRLNQFYGIKMQPDAVDVSAEAQEDAFPSDDVVIDRIVHSSASDESSMSGTDTEC